ncbi:MAG: hypothetical protein ACE5ID_01850 [Acidobacteriota bacterium]
MLKLSEAEIDLLLPAPLPRRQVMNYGLVKSQPGILLGATLISLLLPMGGLWSRISVFPLAWILLTLWDLHGTVRNLWYARQGQLQPGQALRSRGTLLAAATLLVFLAARDIHRLWPHLEGSLTSPGHPAWGGGFLQMIQLFVDGPLFLILAPLRWLIHPLFLAAPLARLAALVFPAVLLLAHHQWVIRSTVRFEDAVQARARLRAVRQDPSSRYSNFSPKARQRHPFPLVPGGPPELAVVWKNLIQLRRWSLGQTLLVGSGLLLVLLFLPPSLHAPRLFFVLVSLAGAVFLVFLPLSVGLGLRNDLRMDLLRLEIISAWPVGGWRLLLAEAAAPILEAALRSALAAGLVLVGWGGWQLRQWLDGASATSPFQLGWGAPLGLTDTAALMAAVFTALPVTVGLATLALAVMNFLALLFPGWVQLGPVRRQGAGNFGQNMLITWGLALVLLLGLLPGGLMTAFLLGGQWFFSLPFRPWEGPCLALLAAVLLAAESGALLYLAGERWDGLDPSREILAGES